MPETPEMFAERGEEIYETVRAEYEQAYPGQYVAVDVALQKLHVAPTPEGAIDAARAGNPNGKFHLIRVGARGAFKVSSLMAARNASGQFDPDNGNPYIEIEVSGALAVPAVKVRALMDTGFSGFLLVPQE